MRTFSRTAQQADFLVRFQLVAAMKSCPCGYLGHHGGRCRCTPNQILCDRSRISGPLMDRIDLQVEVPALEVAGFSDAPHGESSGVVRERVSRAREVQLHRQGCANALLADGDIERQCAPDAGASKLLREAT